MGLCPNGSTRIDSKVPLWRGTVVGAEGKRSFAAKPRRLPEADRSLLVEGDQSGTWASRARHLV